MLKALKYFWKEQPIALSAFVLALIFLIFFGGRFLLNFIYFNDPAHRNQALEAWMTPRYVGMSWKLPPHILDEVMQIEEKGKGKRIKLDQVVARMGISLEELEARIRSAKQEHEAMSPEERKARKDAFEEKKKLERKERKKAEQSQKSDGKGKD